MSSISQTELERRGAAAYDKSAKTSGEIFAITYGATVNMLLQDAGGLSVSTSPATIEERCEEVNKKLLSLGERIGARLIDEFLAKVDGLPTCKVFEQSIEVLVLVGLRMFLGLIAKVKRADERSGDVFVISFEQNPLNGFTELPEPVRPHLWYSNALCGAICGAMRLVDLRCTAVFTKCVLRGDATHEIVVTRQKN